MLLIELIRPSFSTSPPYYFREITCLLVLLFYGYASAKSLQDLICQKSKMIAASQDTLTEIT